MTTHRMGGASSSKPVVLVLAAGFAVGCASGGSTTASAGGEVSPSGNVADTSGRVAPATGSISPSATPPTLGAGVTGAPQPGSPAVASRDSTTGAAVTTGTAAGMRAGAAGAASATEFTDLGTRLAATATSDAQIVGLLHQSNASEIAAGQLAQQRAQDAAVKSFAQQMVSEHTALDTRGNALATQAGIAPALPDSTLPQADALAMTTLQGAGTGSAFDRAYMAQQVGAHQRTLALVEASIGKAQNAQLKAMLQNEVRPKVAAHLQQAQTLQRTVGTAP